MKIIRNHMCAKKAPKFCINFREGNNNSQTTDFAAK